MHRSISIRAIVRVAYFRMDRCNLSTNGPHAIYSNCCCSTATAAAADVTTAALQHGNAAGMDAAPYTASWIGHIAAVAVAVAVCNT